MNYLLLSSCIRSYQQDFKNLLTGFLLHTTRLTPSRALLLHPTSPPPTTTTGICRNLLINNCLLENRVFSPQSGLFSHNALPQLCSGKPDTFPSVFPNLTQILPPQKPLDKFPWILTHASIPTIVNPARIIWRACKNDWTPCKINQINISEGDQIMLFVF